MRTLFGKLLGWFVVSTLLVAAGAGIVFFQTDLHFAEPGEVLGRRLRFALGEAARAYQSGGRSELGAFLSRTQEIYDQAGFVTDRDGINLLDGTDHSRLLQAAQAAGPLVRLDGTWFLAQQSEDGRFWYFAPAGSEAAELRGFVWRFGLLAVLAVLGLTYMATRHFGSPLAELRQAMTGFGQGDLSTRVALRRRDELGALGKRFDDMAAQIENLVDSQRRLLRDVSHELRSPLTRLRLAVDLGRSSPDPAKAFDRIEKETERLNQLIGELLSLSRAEAEPGSVDLLSVRADEILQDVVEQCRTEAEAAQVTLRLHNSGPATIRGDEELLRRAFENILRNAIRYTDSDTVVDVLLRPEEDSIAFEVRDHGPGVPESDLAHLFEPFYRVESDRNRERGGTGVGLAIAQRAVSVHGGQIEARNADPGLVVAIRIPSERPLA